MSFAVAVSDIAVLIRDGKITRAKGELRRLLDHGDPHSLDILTRCAELLQQPASVGMPKLRYFWKTSTPDDRDLIAACVPADGTTHHQPEPEHPRPATTRPRQVEIRHQPPRPTRPATETDTLQRAHELMDTYERTRAGVDDEPPAQQPADAYAIDYTRAALPPLRHTPCVRCWLERSNADRTAAGHDDGLCQDCRDRGRPGIEAHPAAERVSARCAFIAAHNPTAVAHAILRREWQRANTTDRTAIAQWFGTWAGSPAEDTLHTGRKHATTAA